MELKWFIKEKQTNVFAQLIYHFGMENIVLPVLLPLNMIQKKNNVIIVLKDSSEITVVMLVSQDF
jgi:hypothetical protein